MFPYFQVSELHLDLLFRIAFFKQSVGLNDVCQVLQIRWPLDILL